MADSSSQPPQPPSRPGWSVPQPETIPPPTVWPAALALAVTLIFWSIVTSPIIAGIGAGLFAIALAGWIADIRHERRKP